MAHSTTLVWSTDTGRPDRKILVNIVLTIPSKYLVAIFPDLQARDRLNRFNSASIEVPSRNIVHIIRYIVSLHHILILCHQVAREVIGDILLVIPWVKSFPPFLNLVCHHVCCCVSVGGIWNVLVWHCCQRLSMGVRRASVCHGCTVHLMICCSLIATFHRT